METIKITQDVELSRIIQGLWRLKNWNFETINTVNFMHRCIELGVTTFDTAEIYGDYGVEEEIGKALLWDPSLRSKIQLVTKTGINMKSPVRS